MADRDHYPGSAEQDSNPDAAIALGDATALTKGGAEKSIEAKQRPYD
ncbi:albusnodin family lasso peptide [Jiangella alkaliphila]|uniref:Uncharacterized protein n=1 Tax=Jiangella alkaliphila TaxID=419479 RepID=A0A1H2GJP3_9ACTN|nr:albusnodin family lasso peptide [Jiangella alkaliphila]SDU19669.1 hypothetical protein SAMN04488563_0530 [Jiangella alkaliphila]